MRAPLIHIFKYFDMQSNGLTLPRLAGQGLNPFRVMA